MTKYLDIELIVSSILKYTPKVIGAILTIIIGFWIARIISNLAEKMMKKRNMDAAIASFLTSLINVGIKVMILLAAAGMFGVETTSFIALFGAIVFAVGMALQGSLAHFASGVLILSFRPYKVGDLVEIGGGKQGTVVEVQIFNTILLTLDNKKIIVPNGLVTNNVITNISGQDKRGVELSFGISYTDDIDKARDIILSVGKTCQYILPEPEQKVFVGELADSSVNLVTRPFVKSEHYFDALFYMTENVKKEFDKEGISIPFPQMDIHMDK